jgi:hypothetical protein
MMTRWASPLLFVAAIAVLLGLCAGTAQAQNTTASMTGTVVDENGDPLPGTNVLAVHQPTGTRYGVATGNNGQFTIQGMRVGGPYTVTASFVGYQETRRTGIQLQLDQTREINFQLQEQTAEMEEVEVIGRQTGAVIDMDRTGAATNVSEEEIDELPTIGRSISDFARLVPQSGGDGSLLGANDRFNSIQIDGATLNDVFGLGDAVPGSQVGAQPISLDAIKEFNVNLAPYDVRSSGFTGGQINAITKSGTNQFKGSLRFKGGDPLSYTGDLNGVGAGEFGQYFLTGTLGGPIIKDELFFFVTAEIRRQNNPLNTRVGTNLQGADVFDAPQSTVMEVKSIFQDTYGYNPGGTSPIDSREDNEKLLAKLDWNINQNHRLTLRHNYVDAIDNQSAPRGESTFSFSNRQIDFESTQNSTTLQLNSTFGSDVFNEALFVYTRILDNRKIKNQPFPSTTINLESGRGAILLGGVDDLDQANRLEQNLFEFTDDFTYITGDHTLTVGTNNKLFQFENRFIRNFYGTYEFNSFVVPESRTPEGMGVDSVSAVEAFRRGQPSSFEYSYSTAAAQSDQPTADFSALQFSGYVQDEWQVNSDLRLTLGLRLDVPVVPNEPTFNPTVFEAFGENTSEVASGNLLWSPRLGFNYERSLLGNDLSTQVRGGAGIFSGDVPFVWISNQFNNTGADINRIERSSFDQPKVFYGGGNPDGELPGRRFVPKNIGANPSAQPLPTSAPFCQENPGSNRCSELLSPVQKTSVNLVTSDFQYPQTFRTNLAVDQELPYGLVATLEGIYSNSINNVTFRDINLQAPEEGTEETKYGRPLYGAPGIDGRGSPNRVSENFTNVIELSNTNKGYKYNITGELQRNVREGLGGSIAYTYSRAKNTNDASASIAKSNWNDASKDVNDPRVGTSQFELRHRVLGTLNYTFEYADRFRTTFGLVYEGESGSPKSWIYDGDDANGDGEQFNDLLFVPKDQDDIILESENWDLMNAFIESNEALDEARGSVVRRNTARAPWQHIVDVKFSQTIETFKGQTLKFTADIENFLNLLNDNWGLTEESFFGTLTGWNLQGYVQPSDVGTTADGRILTEDDVGKPRVSFSEDAVREQLSGERFTTSAANIQSRWRLRLGVVYSF